MNLFIVVEVRKMYVLLELEKVKKNSCEEYFWQNKSIFVGECFFLFQYSHENQWVSAVVSPH